MKYVKLFLLLATGIIMSGCHNDDDKKTQADILNGTWYLSKTLSPQSGVSETYKKGDVKWTINESQHKLVATDKRIMIPEQTSMYDLPNDTYTYTISAWGGTCDNAFRIEELNFGCITLDGESLTLTTEAADGVRYSFVR